MSSMYVRDMVRSWATNAGALLGLPFFDTVNREVDPQEPAWLTVQFLGGNNEQSTYCRQLERGTFDLMFFTRGGAGDASLSDAEATVAEFMTNTDPSGLLQLRLAGPPEDFPAGGGVPWFVISFPVDYTFSH